MKRIILLAGLAFFLTSCEKKTIISHSEYEELVGNQDANKIYYMQRTIDSLGIELNKCKKTDGR